MKPKTGVTLVSINPENGTHIHTQKKQQSEGEKTNLLSGYASPRSRFRILCRNKIAMILAQQKWILLAFRSAFWVAERVRESNGEREKE